MRYHLLEACSSEHTSGYQGAYAQRSVLRFHYKVTDSHQLFAALGKVAAGELYFCAMAVFRFPDAAIARERVRS
jgi:hypothetical protein